MMQPEFPSATTVETDFNTKPAHPLLSTTVLLELLTRYFDDEHSPAAQAALEEAIQIHNEELTATYND